MEKWRQIEGFPHWISDKGRVISMATGRELKQSVQNGYWYVQLTVYDKGHPKLTHRLVAHAFHGPPPEPYYHVHHIDHDPLHCSASNLQWVTPEENRKLYKKHGHHSDRLKRRGKVPQGLREEIRGKDLSHGDISELARILGVSKQYIHKLVHEEPTVQY